MQLLHNKVDIKPAGYNFSTDFDPDPDSQSIILFTGTDASIIREGKDMPRVNKEFFNFDPLEDIGGEYTHTPSDHICTPVTKWEGNLLDCSCVPDLIGKVDIQQMVSHLKFLAT